jgi:hypothetical protein
MDATRRTRAAIGLALTCVAGVVGDWILGLHGLGIAFALGAALAASVMVLSAATQRPIPLAAVTAEPAQGWAEFHRELNRARRFDRPFGIVRFVGVGADEASGVHVRDRVAALARRIDRLWIDEGDLFMLLPESDAGAVETAVARARYRIGDVLETSFTAIFPANGITSGSLVACLYQGDASPVAIGALGPVTPPAEPPASTDGNVAGVAT